MADKGTLLGQTTYYGLEKIALRSYVRKLTPTLEKATAVNFISDILQQTLTNGISAVQFAGSIPTKLAGIEVSMNWDGTPVLENQILFQISDPLFNEKTHALSSEYSLMQEKMKVDLILNGQSDTAILGTDQKRRQWDDDNSTRPALSKEKKAGWLEFERDRNEQVAQIQRLDGASIAHWNDALASIALSFCQETDLDFSELPIVYRLTQDLTAGREPYLSRLFALRDQLTPQFEDFFNRAGIQWDGSYPAVVSATNASQADGILKLAQAEQLRALASGANSALQGTIADPNSQVVA